MEMRDLGSWLLEETAAMKRDQGRGRERTMKRWWAKCLCCAWASSEEIRSR